MKVPANIIETKYTSGNEFVFLFNYKYYQGPYYELNGKTFVGKEFNVDAPELIKADSKEINPLLTSAKTLVYGSLNKIKLNDKFPSSIISKGNINGGTRYFSKKNNNNPILIREITKETFNQYKDNPIYQTISIDFPEGGYFGEQQNLDNAEKIMPGIKAFITSELPPD
jgi:hypothetical protein